MNTLRVRVLGSILAISLLAAACASDDSAGPSQPAGTDTASAADASILDFEAPTLDGGTLEGSSLAGKDVAMWFWAPWCPTCNQQAPGVAQVLVDPPEGVTFVGMAGRDGTAEMQEFVDRHGLASMRHGVSEDGSLWARFGVIGQPTWLFIDDDGSTELHQGPIEVDALRERLADLAAS